MDKQTMLNITTALRSYYNKVSDGKVRINTYKRIPKIYREDGIIFFLRILFDGIKRDIGFYDDNTYLWLDWSVPYNDEGEVCNIIENMGFRWAYDE